MAEMMVTVGEKNMKKKETKNKGKTVLKGKDPLEPDIFQPQEHR